MIVDEALSVRLRLMQMLEQMGFHRSRLTEASSVADVLGALDRGKPRLIFTEFLGIHPIDGLDLIHEILERAPLTNVVLVTSEPKDSPDVREAVRKGVFAVIEKPLRPEDLRRVMDAVDEDAVARAPP